MALSGSTTVILPLDLGAASNFEESNFPLAYHSGPISNTVNKGSLLLSATLDEILKIKDLGVDLSSNPQFLLNTKLKYEECVVVDSFIFRLLTSFQSGGEADKIREVPKESQPA